MGLGKRATEPAVVLYSIFLAIFSIPLAMSRRAKKTATKLLLQFHVAVACMAGIAFYTAILGDGNEFRKHLFVFNFLLD